ncbi:hypothetical protein [Brachyspira aalborgi]|uniref:hypothetical protein n=1 Tax=Brachyspira aalborgi TaxID=29522 RepID=UPI001F551C31|nr:hypothetical protein [Brachyspira aalborgi]
MLNNSVLNYYSNDNIDNINYNSKYDFKGECYNSLYPNLHKYPATMLPQIGLELLKEFKAKKTNLLDPYCGSGSSFSSGLEYGICRIRFKSFSDSYFKSKIKLYRNRYFKYRKR